ncbi:MAG TPA: glycogen debranching N-terminal domain-containing protein [Vitreimonas sp.]|nr:glycogen debranching N-terminal domain-containing protein [Vitreimonas sp.]
MARAADLDAEAIRRQAGAGTRFFQPRDAPIPQATDLGSVQVLKHEHLFLLTDPFGDIHPDSRGLGLYLGDTRILSCNGVRIGGERPVLLQGSAGGNFRGTIHLTNAAIERNPATKRDGEPGQLAGRSLGISRERLLAGDALQERLRIVNHAEHREVVEVDLELADDSADIFEVRGYPRPERGTVRPVAVRGRRVTFRYDGLDGRRRQTHLVFSKAANRVSGVTEESPPTSGWIRVHWRFELAPGGREDLSWTVWSTDGPTAVPPALFPDPPRVTPDEGAAAYDAWAAETTAVSTDHELFNLAVQRGMNDLRLLVNDGPDEGERYVAAGVPWFATLFGRDSIITALQMLAFRPQLAVETLNVLAARQATEVDDERDAEPGKILHELRGGEMAATGELPFRPYYGSVDATPLWLILLADTFAWTGDVSMVDRYWPQALAALEWIDRWGDLDGDGFVEYRRRTKRGLLNQGWKDSRDSIRNRDGHIVQGPIALSEVQGYVYRAKLGIAGLAAARGEADLAARLESEADELRERFEAAFWVEDQGYYAIALDGEKRPADAIASNAGQVLWSGIASPGRARLVADRLLSPELNSGWGIRTYGAGQPGYNPIGYHTGTVWPHDTALIGAGLKRYGLHDEANRLVGNVFEAAQRFPDFRLPELFCGFDRATSPLPVPYPVACSPQAWAAGAPFLFLQTMLGLTPHAARHELELHQPHLPDWVGRVTMKNLRLGPAAVDVLFHRWRGTTSAEVLRKAGDISVTIRL